MQKYLALVILILPGISFSNTLEVCDQIVSDELFFRGVQKACSSVSRDPLFRVEIDGRQMTYEYVQNKCGKVYETDKYPIGEAPSLKRAESKFESYIFGEHQKYNDDYDFCGAQTKRYKSILSRYLNYPSDFDE